MVCVVTGSTQAGMIAGFALENRSDRHVIGIDASATLDKTIAQVSRIARDTAAKIGLDRRSPPADEITIVDGYSAGIYGIPDAQTIDAIRTCARLEGMLTDPVYEGKSMAGMIGMIRSGEIPAGSRVLYVAPRWPDLPAGLRRRPVTTGAPGSQRPDPGSWADERWSGWWGDNPPYHHPVFVLTHHPRAPIDAEHTARVTGAARHGVSPRAVRVAAGGGSSRTATWAPTRRR